MNKKVIIILGLVALILVFASALFLPEKEKPGEYSQKDDSKLVYSKSREEKRDQLIKSKPRLASSDNEVKGKITTVRNPLHQTQDFVITYNSSNDSFEVLITTIRINAAKEEAAQWFASVGFSRQAICILPVVFTISERDAESLRGLNIIFDPLPIGC